ncbi:MAG: DUF899 family protein [Rhizobiales bacterium]|nr:DUF899 family protein [Hyphomicrobiales bacterium]
MNYKDTSKRLAEYRGQIAALRKKMREVQAETEPQEVKDYEFSGSAGKIRLSDLFGTHDTLLIIHNMGTGCPYCTLWADGFNGVVDHLQNRAAFVVASPDTPEQQRKFAASRGWKFPMVSHHGTSFADDMGYSRDGHAMPGVSVFKRKGGKIARVSDTSFSPGDDFCTVWHLFDLIPEGAAGWQPKYKYVG